MDDEHNFLAIAGAGVILISVCAGGLLWGRPQYNVYSAKMDGQAELSQAVSTRQTKVLEAKARYESAKFDAMAEVERAKGTRDANNVVISSFGSTEERLRYLQIEALKDTQNRVIYVPTEAMMPIGEAGRSVK